MKTEQFSPQAPGNVIWVNNVGYTTTQTEEPLPIIGTYQLSTILSNFDPNSVKLTEQIPTAEIGDSFLPTTICKVTNNDNIIILRETPTDNPPTNNYVTNVTTTEPKPKKVKKNSATAQILYFVCNLCPFLCLDDDKIKLHLSTAHTSKSEKKSPQFKCPACANNFYKLIPLKSHLTHDHSVSNSDLDKIIEGVIYSSKHPDLKYDRAHVHKSGTSIFLNNTPEPKEAKKPTVPPAAVEAPSGEHCMGGGEGEDASLHSFDNYESIYERVGNVGVPGEVRNSVGLPQFEITPDSAEQIFTTVVGQQQPPPQQQNEQVKVEDQKQMHRCHVPQCKVRLQDASKMNYHVRCHNEGGFLCPECDHTFSFWKPLTSHLWRIHKLDMELYGCDKCDYKTYSLGKLNNIHKLIHGDVKAYQCTVCVKAFKNAKQLRNHVVTHRKDSGKVAQRCELCNKDFSDKRQLTIHRDVVHNKIRPYLCSYCGYKGSSRSALKMHARQHTGEKPFCCDQCSFATSDHNSLRRHKLRHSGQKPYKCAFCPYACIQSSTYKVHLRTRHPELEKELVFSCEECHFRSVNKQILTAHMATCHASSSSC